PPARVIDAAMVRDLAKPEGDVLRRFERSEVLMQMEENILCQLLGRLTVAQKVQGDAEDHRLLLAHQPCEIAPWRAPWSFFAVFRVAPGRCLSHQVSGLSYLYESRGGAGCKVLGGARPLFNTKDTKDTK